MFSPLDPGVPHYPCCLVANAVLYLTNCLPGRAGGLGTNKTCVNSPFQFVSPGLAEPPETTNIVRLGPGSYRSQSHSHSSVVLKTLDLRNWMKRMKNYTLSLDVLKFGNFSKADSGSGWGWIFKTFHNENSRQTDYASSYCWCFRSLFIVNKSQRERTWHEMYALWEFRLHFIFMPLCSVKVQRTKFSVKRA